MKLDYIEIENLPMNAKELDSHGIDFENWPEADSFLIHRGMWIAKLGDGRFHAMYSNEDKIFNNAYDAFRWLFAFERIAI